VRQLALQALGGLDAVRRRQAQVHEDDVGRQLLDGGERLAPAAGLAHDLDVLLEVQDVADAATEQGVAVDDDDPRLAVATVTAPTTLVDGDLLVGGGVGCHGGLLLP
jgi:hypothetical protein